MMDAPPTISHLMESVPHGYRRARTEIITVLLFVDIAKDCFENSYHSETPPTNKDLKRVSNCRRPRKVSSTRRRINTCRKSIMDVLWTFTISG